MMLFASLITRSFNARRTNLDRDHVSLAKRMTIDDFFGRYPSLETVLRDELERGWNQSLKEAPVSYFPSDVASYPSAVRLTSTLVPV